MFSNIEMLYVRLGRDGPPTLLSQKTGEINGVTLGARKKKYI